MVKLCKEKKILLDNNHYGLCVTKWNQVSVLKGNAILLSKRE